MSNEKVQENLVDNFRDSLKVISIDQSIIRYPADEDVLDKMDKTDLLYSFDMENIDKKIKVSKVSKER